MMPFLLSVGCLKLLANEGSNLRMVYNDEMQWRIDFILFRVGIEGTIQHNFL